MPGIDMTQMVRRAVQPTDLGASADRELSAERQPAGFLQLLRKKQQAADSREEGEQLVREDEGREKTSDQKTTQSPQTDEAAGDVHTALAFQVQTTAGSLLGEWNRAFAGTQESGIRMAVQEMTGQAETIESVEEQPGPAAVPDVSAENGFPENILSENILSENILSENSLLENAFSEDGASLFQEKQADGEMAQAASEALPKTSSKEDLSKAASLKADTSKISLSEHQEQMKENSSQIYMDEDMADGQKKPTAEIPQKVTLQEMQQKPALQEAENPEDGNKFDLQVQANNIRQNKDEMKDEPAPDRAMHPQQAVSHESQTVQSQIKPEVPVKTTEAELPADLGKALADRLPPDDGTLTIELEPASLGKVTIKVIYETGRASISLISSNPKTLEILNQNAGEIAGILAEKTGRETMIYTYQPEQEFADSREGGGQEHREHQEERENKKREQPDSFAQQLRLGLV